MPLGSNQHQRHQVERQPAAAAAAAAASSGSTPPKPVSRVENGPLAESNNLNSLANSTLREKAPSRETTATESSENVDLSQTEREKPRLTIKELRKAAQEASQQNSIQNDRKSLSSNLPAPAKKKPSLFGGFFQVKEPTQVALNQVAAQMIAQHGSTNPTKVPNVRLEKMPHHVPKVNSKWDGLPESVKQKENPKASSKESALFSSIDGSKKKFESRNTSSSGSSGSRGRSSGSHRNPGNHRMYAQSCNSSGDLAMQRPAHSRQRATSIKSQATSSTSGPGSIIQPLPEPTPEEVTVVPSYLREAIAFDAGSNLPGSHRKPVPVPELPSTTFQSISTRPRAIPGLESPPPIGTIPEHSKSLAPSPHENPPLTPPSSQPDKDSDIAKESAPQNPLLVRPGKPVNSRVPTATQKQISIVNPAFLAGEAQELVLPQDDDDDDESWRSDLPLRSWDQNRQSYTSYSSPSVLSRKQQDLEKRPDSSRARLGLRASMLVSDNDAPWTNQDWDDNPLRSPKSPTSPLAFPSPQSKRAKGFGLFGKEKSKP